MHQDRVDHLSRAQILEVQSQHGAAPSVNARVRTLPGPLLERLSQDEAIYAALGAREAVLNVPEVIARRGPKSIEALLDALAVKGRPSL